MADDLAALVAAAKRGDRAAFDELVRATYAGHLHPGPPALSGNEEDARDVVQEAYLRAYRAIGRFRGDAQFTHLALPDHRQLRGDRTSASAAATATTS